MLTREIASTIVLHMGSLHCRPQDDRRMTAKSWLDFHTDRQVLIFVFLRYIAMTLKSLLITWLPK
jgi:hypothetical protein